MNFSSATITFDRLYKLLWSTCENDLHWALIVSVLWVGGLLDPFSNQRQIDKDIGRDINHSGWHLKTLVDREMKYTTLDHLIVSNSPESFH